METDALVSALSSLQGSCGSDQGTDVLSSFRKRLSYSNVTATAALFIALGGTSYAVIRVDSGDVVDNSLRSADLRNNTVRGRDIRDRTLHAP